MSFTDADITAIVLSLKIAAVATLASLPPAILIAFVLARRDFFGKAVLNGLVHLPLVLPPVVTGYLLLVAFGRQGWAGDLLERCCGLTLAFRWTGAALAAAVMAFPLTVRAIRLSMEAVDSRLEAAAATLGAAPPLVFLTVTLPLAVPGILAGAILGFAKALGEFGATITFVSNSPSALAIEDGAGENAGHGERQRPGVQKDQRRRGAQRRGCRFQPAVDGLHRQADGAHGPAAAGTP